MFFFFFSTYKSFYSHHAGCSFSGGAHAGGLCMDFTEDTQEEAVYSTTIPHRTVNQSQHSQNCVTRQESRLDSNTVQFQIRAIKKEKVLPWLGLGIVFMTSSIDILGS